MAEDRPKLTLGKLTQPPRDELPTWEEIKEALFAKDCTSLDEHAFKLVQICHEMDLARGKGFYDSGDDASAIYKRASLSAINYPPMSVNFTR